MPHVIVIGAGISGLATAFHLQELHPQAEITVLEADSRVGGTIWTERRAGFQVEIGPNGFLNNRDSTQDLCRRIGIHDRLIAASDAARHRFLFLDNKLQLLPEGLWSFLRSPLLDWRSKLAILTERFRKRGPAGDESVHDFITRRATQEVAETFGDALVTGIHAGDPRLLSIAAAFPRISEMERVHGSILAGMAAARRQRRAEAQARGEPYRPGSQTLTFREGLRLLVETLRDRLRRPPVHGVQVQRIHRRLDDARPWIVTGEGNDCWSADAVVLACPAHQQQVLVGGLDGQLATMIGQIPYTAVAVIALGYHREDVRHPLDGFGYIAPQRTRQDMLGAQWCSSIFPDRAPLGMVLLRLMAGGWHRRDVVGWEDEQLLAAARRQLHLALGITAEPVFHHIVRWNKAIPQYHLGHLERVAGIEARAATHPGLFLTGNAYHGVALNDCTENAVRVARAVRDWLAGKP